MKYTPIILIILIVSFFVFTAGKNAPAPQTSPLVTITPAAEGTPTSPTTQSSRYTPYSKEGFEAAKGKKRVYYFHAPWCPTCVPTDKEFTANLDKIPQDVILFKTDYDSSKDLKKQYAVTYQHTFVLVDDVGNEIKKWNGGGIEDLNTNTK